MGYLKICDVRVHITQWRYEIYFVNPKKLKINDKCLFVGKILIFSLWYGVKAKVHPITGHTVPRGE